MNRRFISFFRSTNDSAYRNVPKRNRQNPNRTIQLNNQIPKGETTDNAPDYLPYSVYSNLEQMQQKAQEEIHPLRSQQAVEPKLPSQKPKKRHSKPLNLTGEVNLGTNKFRNRERKQRVRKPVEVITEEVVTNAGRHHHHPNDILEVETTPTQATTELEILGTTPTPIADKVSALEAKKKLDEKAQRRERLKQKLAALTPEERQAFLLMKQQRADAKKKGLGYATWTPQSLNKT